MTKPRIGAIIRNAREQRELTRERLALQSDVSTAMVTRLELLDKEPNPAALARIARRLDLSVEQLEAASSVPWRGKSETRAIRAYRRGRGGGSKPGQGDVPLDFAVADPDGVLESAGT